MKAEFQAPLWVYDGPTPWYFLTLPADLSDDIDEATRGVSRGFGSVRVEVTVGETVWSTSVFPSREHAAYILPVKRAVRLGEALQVGVPVAVEIRVLDVTPHRCRPAGCDGMPPAARA